MANSREDVDRIQRKMSALPADEKNVVAASDVAGYWRGPDMVDWWH